MSDAQRLTTPLHDKHVEAGAAMAPEEGWEMPRSYRGLTREVLDVRARAGVFDVSHTGRLRIRGDGAIDLLERVCTADAARQEDDTALPTLLCNEAGGIIDEGLLLRLEDSWMLLTSPCNRRKVLSHLQACRSDLDAKVEDQTFKTARIAVAGPAAPALLDAVLGEDVSGLSDGAVRAGTLLIARYVAVRTRQAGLWTLEVILPNMVAGQAWRFITQKAGENCVPPAGMAAREVLRIEAGLPRCGHELDESIDPITAGLEARVDPGRDFIGRDALLKIKERGAERRLVGLNIQAPEAGPGRCTTPAAASAGQGPHADLVPRPGSVVSRTGAAPVGSVTSAAYSPALEAVIAMAYVAREAAGAGTSLLVGSGRQTREAKVVALPFAR